MLSYLVAKTVDLRKDYKQLPLSESGRKDAYLSVWCPNEKSVHIFQSLVLLFGSRPSVREGRPSRSTARRSELFIMNSEILMLALARICCRLRNSVSRSRAWRLYVAARTEKVERHARTPAEHPLIRCAV